MWFSRFQLCERPQKHKIGSLVHSYAAMSSNRDATSKHLMLLVERNADPGNQRQAVDAGSSGSGMGESVPIFTYTVPIQRLQR